MDQRTLKRYLEILEFSYQVSVVQPLFSNRLKRLIKTPKIFLKDTGLLTYFLSISSVQQLLSSPFKGAVLETWLYQELSKILQDKRIHLNYYRQQDGVEVDFVISKGTAHVLVECKSTLPSSVKSMKGVETFRQAYPDTPVVIFHSGSECHLLGHRIYGLPMATLAKTITVGE